jgi:GAF domain-containing protein
VLDLGDLAGDLAVRTCVSVPVFVRAELFGVLTVYLEQPTVADEVSGDVGLLAQQVGLAIAAGGALTAVHPRLAPVAAAG